MGSPLKGKAPSALDIARALPLTLFQGIYRPGIARNTLQGVGTQASTLKYSILLSFLSLKGTLICVFDICRNHWSKCMGGTGKRIRTVTSILGIDFIGSGRFVPCCKALRVR